MKNIGFHEADVKTKQPQGFRKTTCDALKSLLSVGDMDIVDRKEKVLDQPLFGLLVRL